MKTLETATLVDRVRRHYDDGCFACGRDNPIGLHLDAFTFDGTSVAARFEPRSQYRGAGKTLHGGIVATALDEILVWAGILAQHVMSVTATMDIRYRRAIEVSEVLTVRAWIDERSGRRLRASGELLASDEVRAEASGLYVVTGTLEEMGVIDGGSGGDHSRV